MVIAEHRGIIDDHDVPQVGQLLNERQNPVGVSWPSATNRTALPSRI